MCCFPDHFPKRKNSLAGASGDPARPFAWNSGFSGANGGGAAAGENG